MDQYLLLTIEYVCTTKGIAIPYSDVAAVMREELSGEAIKQHLAKLYKIRVNHDRTVPPPHGKQGRRHGKASKAGDSATKVKQSRGKDDDDADSDDETPGKGSSLLWHGPWKSEKKPKPSHVAAKGELNTPVAKRGIKGRGQGEAASNGGGQSGEKTKSTNKRSRKKTSPKQAITNEPIDSEGESPSKRKKTYKLRQKKDVSYKDDHADLDADLLVRNDDEALEAPEEDSGSMIKIDRGKNALSSHEIRLLTNLSRFVSRQRLVWATTTHVRYASHVPWAWADDLTTTTSSVQPYRRDGSLWHESRNASHHVLRSHA